MAEQRFDDACGSCRSVQGLLSLTNAPRILETPHWLVEHAHPTAIRGWLVLLLTRHCGAIHDLTADELASFGRLLGPVCQALRATLGAEKEYVVQFAEKEGFAHVHFHVIARLPDWPASLRGDRVFSGLGERVARPLPSEVVTPLALEIREQLLAQLPEAAPNGG